MGELMNPNIPRVIPLLLLRNGGLVKSIRFKDHTYIGDPRNAIRILNEKEVDELILIDIRATAEGREPDLRLIREVAEECFMPFCYGGGVRSIDMMERIFKLGAEKIAINSGAVYCKSLISEAAARFGSQSVVGAIDARRVLFGSRLAYIANGTRCLWKTAKEHARWLEDQGVGEVLLTSIDRDGTMSGYDQELVLDVTSAVKIPVIAAGGAGCINDIADVIHIGGASAAAAGSLFVYHGRHKAVLINYPAPGDLKAALSEKANLTNTSTLNAIP